MWLFALFDLPVTSRTHKRAYARFRRELLRDGFVMLQFSVYARYCASEESCESHRIHVRASVPIEGQVRVLSLTDRQYEKMETYLGNEAKPPESPPVQMELF